jgi:hypothetical protein
MGQKINESTASCTSGSCGVSPPGSLSAEDLARFRAEVRREILAELERYSADRTELIDFALGTSGGNILGASESHKIVREQDNWFMKFFRRCFMRVNKPDIIINVRRQQTRATTIIATRGLRATRSDFLLVVNIFPLSLSERYVCRQLLADVWSYWLRRYWFA